MAHEEEIKEIMDTLGIADKHVVGDIMAHKGIWTAGVSATNNAKKALDNLDLEKGDGWYRVKECRSQYKDHAKELTLALADIIKLGFEYKILREASLPNGLRPDSLVLLKRDGKAVFFCLEICRQEDPEYLAMKVNALNHWPEAKAVFSELMGEEIREMDIVVKGREMDGTFEFESYKEALNG